MVEQLNCMSIAVLTSYLQGRKKILVTPNPRLLEHFPFMVLLQSYKKFISKRCKMTELLLKCISFCLAELSFQLCYLALLF